MREKKAKVIWWYPGGPLHSEIQPLGEAQKHAAEIRQYGGSATVYPLEGTV